MNNKIRSIILLVSLFIFFLIIFYLAIPKSHALTVGVAANASYKMAMAQALSMKKSISNSYQISKTISVYSLYIPYLSYLEDTNRFFKKCSIVNNPKTLNNFVGGINTKYGIDLYAMQYLQNKAELGAGNKMFKQRKIKKYMICVAAYGLIISQAIDNFHNSLQNGAGQVLSNDVYKVSNNGFYNEVGQSLYDAIRHQDGRFKTEFNLIKRQIKDNKCVLTGKNIKCGGVYLSLEASPKMSFGGLEWFDPQSDFGGENGVIEIGYSRNAENTMSADKNKSIEHTAENTNSLTTDILHSLF